MNGTNHESKRGYSKLYKIFAKIRSDTLEQIAI